MSNERLDELLTDYMVARRDHEEAERHAKTLKVKRDDLERSIVATMAETGFDVVKRGDGVRFELREWIDFSVTQQNLDEVTGWLEAQGEVPADFMLQQVSRGRMREWLKENESVATPESMKVYRGPKLYVTGWK